MKNEVSRFVADVVAQARGPVAADRQVQGRTTAPGFGQAAALTRNDGGTTKHRFTLGFDTLGDTEAEL